MKISIITAVFNNSATILECLRTIESQTYRNIEHIIVDGGSTDGTLDIIGSSCRKNIILRSEPDQGIYDAMNKGISTASGDIVGFLHSDDIYQDCNVIEKVARCMSDFKCDSCYGDLLYVDSKDTDKIFRYWKAQGYDRRSFYRGWMPPHPTFFVRRSVYHQYGSFSTDLGSAADYELMLRFLLKHSITTQYIPQVLVKMRIGGVSNATVRNRLRAHRMDRRAWSLNGLTPMPWTLWMKPLRKIGQFFVKPKKTYLATEIDDIGIPSITKTLSH